MAGYGEGDQACCRQQPAISAVAALEDTLRREMYAFIRQAHRPVTRDEAAASAPSGP